MREICASCGRPQRVCLCALIPKQPLMTRTRIIILQHPHETRHKLATVSVVARCLSNCEVFVGRRYRPGTCALLDEIAPSASASSFSTPAASTVITPAGRCRNCGEKKTALLLFPTSTSIDLRTWCQSYSQIISSPTSYFGRIDESNSPNSDGYGIVSPLVRNASKSVQEAEEMVELTNSFGKLILKTGRRGEKTEGGEAVMEEDKSEETCDEGHVLLLIVDGTWQHAKEMVKASMPFLDDFVVQVSLPHDTSREGWGMGDSDSVLRKEPFAGCVSTMEAIARALAILEPDGPRTESTLLSVLQHMVKLQASHFTSLKPRPRQLKKCADRPATQTV